VHRALTECDASYRKAFTLWSPAVKGVLATLVKRADSDVSYECAAESSTDDVLLGWAAIKRGESSRDALPGWPKLAIDAKPCSGR